MRDVDAKRIELEDKQCQIADIDRHIEAAIAVIAQIRAIDDFWLSLPATVRDDFQEFAERLIPEFDAASMRKPHEAVAI